MPCTKPVPTLFGSCVDYIADNLIPICSLFSLEQGRLTLRNYNKICIHIFGFLFLSCIMVACCYSLTRFFSFLNIYITASTFLEAILDSLKSKKRPVSFEELELLITKPLQALDFTGFEKGNIGVDVVFHVIRLAAERKCVSRFNQLNLK